MSAHVVITFGPFQLDLTAGQLMRGDDVLPLRPKSFAVLSLLVHSAGQLVSKESLMQTVWPNVIVNEQALKNCIRELRKALGDTPRNSEFIQTVHGRGYRFIADVEGDQPESAGTNSGGQVIRSFLVDRDEPLGKLQNCYEMALSGNRQMVFVNGEAGIGKSTLVDTFLKQDFSPRNILIGRGQCIYQHGTGDPFMPFLEALIEAFKSAKFDALPLLAQHAPNWYRRLPASSHLAGSPAEQSRKESGETNGMLLEMAEALFLISDAFPVIILLEDLQWSDKATLELISMLARRRERARIMIVATYRLEDVIGTDHPLPSLKQELLVHKKCTEITLQPFSQQGVNAYLERRFTPVDNKKLDLPHFSHQIFERTNGNPLFVSELLQNLIDKGHLSMSADSWMINVDLETAVREIPEDLQLFIDEQVNRLEPLHCRILEVASLVGPQFSARLITDIVDLDYDEIEEICVQLAERDFMLAYSGERILGDGDLVQRFRFIHNLHRETLNQRIPPAQRIRLLRALGEKIELLYPDDATAVYGDLASLFERGKQYARAVHYFLLNADHLHRIGASHEARVHFSRGSELLNLIRDSSARTPLEQELERLRGQLYLDQ